jgi:hypothetical protein
LGLIPATLPCKWHFHLSRRRIHSLPSRFEINSQIHKFGKNRKMGPKWGNTGKWVDSNENAMKWDKMG